MTAETRVLPDLDERTKEELQPPCDSADWTGLHAGGTRPAQFIARADCPNCGRLNRLMCDRHADRIMQLLARGHRKFSCQCKSQGMTFVSVEPLR